ncbi:MAG: hypothetical protein ACNA8W_00275 [Bradymonadaceae bacterium]
MILLTSIVLGLGTLAGCGDPKVERHTVDGNNDEAPPGEFDPDKFAEDLQRIYEEEFGPENNDPEETGEIIIADWVHVLEDDVLEFLIEIEPNHLVFTLGHPLLDEVELMEILVSANEHFPFLRRVVDINREATTITFHTVDASLEEVMISGDYEYSANQGADLPGGLRQRVQPLETMDRQGMAFPGQNTSAFSASFAIGVSYPEGSPSGGIEFELSTRFGGTARMCRDFQKGFEQGPYHELVAIMKWAGTHNRTLLYTPYYHYRMSNAFYAAGQSFANWVRDEGLQNVYDLSFADWTEYPRLRNVPSTNRADVRASYAALRNDSSLSLLQRANLEDILIGLWATRSADDLHWLQMAPVIIRHHCQGEVRGMKLGGRGSIIMDIEPKVTMNFELGALGPTEHKAEWNKTFATKNFFFFIGWVPVWLNLELAWETEIKAKIAAGAKIEIGLGRDRAIADFYYGVRYANGSVVFETLKDIDNSKENTYALVSDGGQGVTATAEGSVRATAELSTGPALSIKLYDAVGLGVGLKAGAKATFGLTDCISKLELGVKLEGTGEIKIPLCPLDSCKIDGTVEIYNSCSPPRTPAWLCGEFEANTCPAENSSGGSRSAPSGSLVCPTCSTQPPSVSMPQGINDVEGAYEIDALWIERDGRKILPVRVEGLMPGQCTADRGTVEYGCPELLWRADFNECDPDGWADKAALIPNFDNFRVKFKENVEVGDILHIIRQGVPASRANADGEVCRASGNMDFYLGALANDGVFYVGDVPTGEGVHNSSSYRIEEQHLNPDPQLPDDGYWAPVPDEYGVWNPDDE